MKTRNIDKLKSLMELAALINSSLDPMEIRTRAIQAATTLMDAEAGSLILVDRERGDLFFEVAIGEKGEMLKEIRMKMGEGIAGWVAQTGESLIISDVQNDPRFFRKADEKSSFSTKDMVAAPLVVKGKILGVLEAMNKLHGTFTDEDRELFVSLANLVAPAIENANLYTELKETFHGTAIALAEALEQRDPYTGGHTRRVRAYSHAIGIRLGLDKEQMDKLQLAAILHDIGKIGVQDIILRKEAPLTRDEVDVMNQHTRIGGEILRHVRSLGEVVPGVVYHHEKFDGTGYPEKLQGEEIPLNARIIAVVDTFDAMTTDRPYRKALSFDTAFSELERCKGTQFDPQVVDAFIETHRERTHGAV